MKKKTNKLPIIGVFGLIVVALGLMVVPISNNTKLTGSVFLTKYKDTPNAVLLDVRTPSEFNSGHINMAINIDYENPNFETEVQKMDTSKTYFVYCRSGNRSAKAVAIMRKNNIKNIYELQGGVASSPEMIE